MVVAKEDEVPFVEELTEEEYAQEAKDQELSPEQEEEAVRALSKQNTLKKILMELDRRDASAREGYLAGRYHHAYSEYKSGLKSLSDLLVGRNDGALRSLVSDDPALEESCRARRRRFCVNAAAACVKIRHWAQGLEACALVLEEGPDDAAQRRKALFRAGVCARGLGELDAAEEFMRRLLGEGGAGNAGDADALDEKTRRDVVKQLRGIREERKRYQKFAKGVCSKKNAGSVILPEKEDEGAKSPEELERMAEIEERREVYVANKRAQDEFDEKRIRGKDHSLASAGIKVPEVLIGVEDCVAILDTLAERYAAAEVQDALKQASFDHDLQFSKGYIIRSRKILGPLQRDIFDKYGFWDSAKEEGSAADSEAHRRALGKLQQSIRYLAQDNEAIAEKMELVQRLAIGDLVMEQAEG